MTNAIEQDQARIYEVIKIWETNFNLAGMSAAWVNVLTESLVKLSVAELFQLRPPIFWNPLKPWLYWPDLAKEYVRGVVSFFPWLVPTLVPLDL